MLPASARAPRFPAVLAIAVGFGALALWAQPVAGQSGPVATTGTFTLTVVIPPRRGQAPTGHQCPAAPTVAGPCRIGDRVLTNVIVTDVVQPASGSIRIVSAE